MMNKTTAVIKY